MENLELFGSQIPDALSVKFPFLLIVTFYLTKTENRTKKPQTQLSHNWKKKLTSAKLRGPWYQKLYFLAYNFTPSPPPPPTSKRTLKKPTQIRVKYKNVWTKLEKQNFGKVRIRNYQVQKLIET